MIVISDFTGKREIKQLISRADIWRIVVEKIYEIKTREETILQFHVAGDADDVEPVDQDVDPEVERLPLC